MRIDPFEAYRYYQALKLHFESDTYDAVKYNYKTSAKPQTFWKRRDKYFFAKTANRFTKIPELISFYVAHFVNDVKWIGEMDKDEIYTAWQKTMQSMSYQFEQDINKLADEVESFDELFKGDPHPFVITKLLENEISLETVVILDRLTGFVARSNISETIIWPDLKRKILKYRPFVNVDEYKLKKKLLQVFTS
jgi:hypothetical protein